MTWGRGKIEAFLSHLATGPNVSVSTQNQTLSAIPFLYRNVLGKGLDRLDDVVRAKKPKRIPVVLTRDEVRAVLTHLHGPSWIAAMIMYGSGLRILECLRPGTEISRKIYSSFTACNDFFFGSLFASCGRRVWKLIRQQSGNITATEQQAEADGCPAEVPEAPQRIRSVRLTGKQSVDSRYERVHTPSMKTAVSIPDKIFRSADSLAKRLGMSRSKLYATALADFLSRRHNQQVTDRLDAIYGEEESALDPSAIKIQVQSLPPEEW